MLHEFVNLAVAFVCFRTGGTVVALLNGVVFLVKQVGYCGNDAQHHDHPYADNNETHPSLVTPHSSLLTPHSTLLTSTPNPARCRSSQ